MKTQDVPIGATVQFRIAGKPLVGRVLQDRGPIGIRGRHLYVICYEAGKGNWHSTELTAEDIDGIEYRPVNLRRVREVDYIIPVQAVEAHSLFVRPEHATLLADFLRSHSVHFTQDAVAIQGEINFLVDKSTSWEPFVAILQEWKRHYAEGPPNSGAPAG